MCEEVQELSLLPEVCCLDNAVYLGIAGFEDRAPATLEAMLNLGLALRGAIILRYDEGQRIRENERNFEKMLRMAQDLTGGIQAVKAEDASDMPLLPQWLPKGDGSEKTVLLLDISGMSHLVMLRSLAHAQMSGYRLLILYTEAERYRPFKEDISAALECETLEDGFFALAEQDFDQAPLMFGGSYSPMRVPEFSGRLAPQLPTTLVVFPTFKRVRTAAILGPLEVNRRIFVLGKPVREELQWRLRLLEMVNYDLYDRDSDTVEVAPTLSPFATYHILRSTLDRSSEGGPENTLVAALGSKMQTVGLWKYCDEHPEVRIVLSAPSRFYSEKYSEGAGGSFYFDPGRNW